VFFDLVVCKLEYLEAVRERCLSSLCLCKVVHNLLIRVCLLYIVVIEIHYGVTIREDFPLNSIVEDDLFFAVLIDPLNLTVMSNDLLHHFHIRRILVVVHRRELHVEFFLLVLIVSSILVRDLNWLRLI
jgi:hypothetical protein